MRVILIRHGMTKGNLEKRYVGSTDEDLLKSGDVWCEQMNRLGQLQETLTEVEVQAKHIFVSPLKRCKQTAELLFPNISQIEIPDFRECNFGDFEYKNYAELNGNSDYQAFIDSNGTIAFPNGESREEFSHRVCCAFYSLVLKMHKKVYDIDDLVLVVHGGTIMSILDRFSKPHFDYFEWQVGNLDGFAGELVIEENSDENLDLSIINVQKLRRN